MTVPVALVRSSTTYPRWQRAATAGILGILVCTGVAACSSTTGDAKPIDNSSPLQSTLSGATSAPSSVNPEATPTGTGGSAYALVTLTSEELTVTFDAMEAAIARCMAELGYSYAPLPAPHFDAIARATTHERTLDDARTRGFVRDLGVIAAPSATEVEFNRKLQEDTAFATAYFGPEDNLDAGCYPQALTAIQGASEPTFAELQQEVERKRAEIQSQIRASAEFADLQEDWSACMHAQGMSFDTIDELANSSWPAPRPTPQEVATAVADFSCQTETELPGFMKSKYLEIEREWLSADPGLIATIAERKREMIERSVQILADH